MQITDQKLEVAIGRMLQTGVMLAALANFLLAGQTRTVFLVGVLPAFLVLWIRRAVPETAEWQGAKHQSAHAEPGFLELFRGPCEQVLENSAAASKAQLSQRAFENGDRIDPEDHPGTPREIAALYLAHTPFEPLLDIPMPFVIPKSARFAHTHCVAGTGHGKTQLAQRLNETIGLREARDRCGLGDLEADLGGIQAAAVKLVDDERQELIVAQTLSRQVDGAQRQPLALVGL